MENIKTKQYKKWRANGLVKQYSPENIGKHFTDFGATFSQIKSGDIKKGEGDIVIINLKLPDDIQNVFFIFSSLSHFFDLQDISSNGIYTNITFGKEFYKEAISAIV